MAFPGQSVPSLLIILVISHFSLFVGALREYDPQLFHFVTRPDIQAPRWHIDVQDQAALAPGYTFIAPYESLVPRLNFADDSWIGPVIYSASGDLIWSGAPLFENRNVESFWLSNVHGVPTMTVLSQLDHGIILNPDYTIRRKVNVLKGDTPLDMHEWNFVDNGTRALVLKGYFRDTKLSDEGPDSERRCKAHVTPFEEYDVDTWTPTWQKLVPEDVFPITDSLNSPQLLKTCPEGGHPPDYFHSNSVDKTPEGNYLLSARHADTIYYISGADGHVIWRLGGKKSDFELGPDVSFAGQHHIRYRGHNETHMIISMFDNASKDKNVLQKPGRSTRALRLALDVKNMKATVDLSIEQPDHAVAHRRGSYQVLENNNIFVGWSEQGRMSEHAPDGRLLMKARLQTDWLGTYRSLKYPWVGRPAEAPAIVSAESASILQQATTDIYVSWNGDTEVAWWQAYATDRNGHSQVSLGVVPRTGFETTITHRGSTDHVVLEGLDKNRHALVKSGPVRTQRARDIPHLATHSSWGVSREPAILALVLLAAVVLCLRLGKGGYFVPLRRWSRRLRYPSRRSEEQEDETKALNIGTELEEP